MHPTFLIPNRRTVAMLMAVASTMPAVITSAQAQSYSGLAQREMIRRQNDIAEAERLLNEGREVYAKGDYQMAAQKYKESLIKVPDVPSNPALVQRRQVIMQHFADASVALAMQNRKVGKYDEARVILESVIKEDPNNFIASRELGYLDDPIRTNPALTYEHTQNVDKVRRTLYMAEGHYNLGKYDEAKKEYESILKIDPYNSAARRGLERLASARSDYYRAAYDHTRAELLSEVDKAWELSIPADAPEADSEIYRKQRPDGTAYITEKLRRIIIPSISFEDITVEEAIDFLRMRSKELDTFELDPAKKGVNFVIRRPRVSAPDAGVDAGDALPLVGTGDPSALRIRELRVTNVPLEQALKYICEATRLKYKVDEYSVTLVPQSEDTQDVFTRTFTVPPDFQTSLEGSGGTGDAAATDPFAADNTGSGPGLLTARPPVIELLKKAGVNFGPGASASLSANGVLLVTNTPSELDKIEQLVDSFIGKQPKQIKITTKFVEITQENNEELGFDWIISPFSIGSDMFGAGGTIGNGLSRTGNDFTGPAIPGVLPGQNDVNNIVTAGTRSGDGALARNSIDAVLNNPNRTAQNQSVAPGIMSLTGLFSDGEVKMIMRGLSQKKGTDLMTAPSITARSGQKATIEIIREFTYPTEYEPPEIPSSFGNNNNQGGGGGVIGPIGGGGIQTFPVTPATPTAWDVRNTGVTLEVEPTITDNDFLIDLRFVPEIVEFEGFINYGSPITTGGTDALGNPVQIVLTENRIEMPVFSTRRVNSSLTIYDGYTVAVGGLMREDVQQVEDKVPILGDIPLIGRLFQSTAENRIKSNLIVFVTAQIIDATGRPLRGAAAETIPMPEGIGAPGGMIDASLLEGL
jgi:general secretion pathway protein D